MIETASSRGRRQRFADVLADDLKLHIDQLSELERRTRRLPQLRGDRREVEQSSIHADHDCITQSAEVIKRILRRLDG